MKMKALKKKTKFSYFHQESKNGIYYRKLETHIIHKHIYKNCQNIFVSNSAMPKKESVSLPSCARLV